MSTWRGPSRIRLRSVVGFAFLLAGLPGCAARERQTSTAAWRQPREIETQLITLINTERRHAGVGPLVTNEQLTVAARRHCDLMTRYGGGHHGAIGDRLKAIGYSFRQCAENTYVTNDPNTGPLAVHRAFMGSLGHAKNVRAAWARDVGVGCIVRNSELFVTEIFGSALGPN